MSESYDARLGAGQNNYLRLNVSVVRVNSENPNPATDGVDIRERILRALKREFDTPEDDPTLFATYEHDLDWGIAVVTPDQYNDNHWEFHPQHPHRGGWAG